MLEKIDFDVARIEKDEYKAIRDQYVSKLLLLQQQAHAQGVGLVVLFEGWDGAGKGGRISDLLYRLDARLTSVHVTDNFDVVHAKEFRKHHLGSLDFYPVMQQFWKALGSRGDMTLFDRGWYTTALQRLIYANSEANLSELTSKNADMNEPLTQKNVIDNEGAPTEPTLAEHLSSIAAFERQLVDDGYVVVKFFLHISEKTQRKRLTKLAENPDTSWRVSKESLKHLDNYETTYAIYDQMLTQSNYDYAPWVLLNGEDRRRANLAVVQTIVRTLEEALNKTPDARAQAAAKKALENSSGLLAGTQTDERSRTPEEQKQARAHNEAIAAEQASHAPRTSVFSIDPARPTLTGVDYHLRLEEDAYREALKREQKRLYELELKMYQKRIPLIVMYEGWDAAGKGGSIKRVAQALDARSYTIIPSPAPSKLELAHPHLWRYWTRLPKAGHVGIFDRSWYGRVLVERVEGFSSPETWARAYDEINEFEYDLVSWGAILIKFWVEIDRETQLQRFEDRAADPLRQWKITDEDWRNRDKYPQYREAVEDMFRLTSTTHAPWMLLESTDKRYARIKALRVINEALEQRLG